jgi:7-cyano-7-deazaguanine synthase
MERKYVWDLIPDTVIDTSLYLGDREQGEKAYIPFRNLLLALQAVKYSDTIVIVGLKDDMVSDKNEDIFAEFSKIMSMMEGREINVISPFWGMTKYDIVKWYQNNVTIGHPLTDTISCYSGTKHFCGECPACFRKWCALKANNIDCPPFTNVKLMQEYAEAAKKDKYDEKRNEIILSQVKGMI